MLKNNNRIPVKDTGLTRSDRKEEPARSLNEQKIYADVQFGQPSSRCRGAGICRVDLYQGINRLRSENCARAIGMVELNAGHLTLRFSKYSICRHLTEKYFAKGRIRLYEPSRISELLCSKLGRHDLTIPSGIYTIRLEGHFYEIAFQLPLGLRQTTKLQVAAAAF